jgi:pSer/pThr/pTyr-binding forkhead associated (FHA) protein
MKLRLRLEKKGSTSAEAFELSGKPSYTVGRLGADVIIDDGKCSRSHALFYFDKEKLHIRDLKSTNGTFMARKRIEVAALAKGASIEIGAVTILVEDFSLDEPESAENTESGVLAGWPPASKKAG